MSDVGIGSTVWVQSEYGSVAETENGCFEIIGETSRSWVIGWVSQNGFAWREKFSVQKKPNEKGERWTAQLRQRNGAKWRVYVSREEVEAAYQAEREAADLNRWMYQIRPGIQKKVGECRDRDVLRQIATLIGYQEEA